EGIEVTMDSHGREVDRDKFGRLRLLDSTPQVQEYQRPIGFDPIDRDHLQTEAARRVISAPQQPVNNYYVTVPVDTIDSKSFRDHSRDIADSLYDALQTMHPVRGAIQRTVQPAT